MPRCLIIGCGYLGEALAPLLKKAGFEVLATTRGGAGRAERLMQIGATPVVFDASKPKALPGADCVISAMAVDRSSGQGMREVHVDGLTAAMRAFPADEVPWLHVSSTSVYGQEDGSWVDEDAPCQPTDTNGEIVLEAEQTLRRQRPDASILRFAGIYGPGRLMRTASLLAGEPMRGDPDRWLNLIHRDDGARVLAFLAARGAKRMLLNVADNRPTPRGQFYEELARLIGAPAPRWVPRAPGEPWGPHERNNRRISAAKLLASGWPGFQFPDFKSGLPGCVG